MKNLLLIVGVFLFSTSLSAQFLQNKKEITSFNGFFNFYYSDDEGKIYLEVDKLNTQFLFVHSITSGLGSNDIGIDRGQLGGGEVVKFIKSGNKLLLIQPNQKFRADTHNDLEKKSVEQAFVRSVLFGFPIIEKHDEKFLIDLTPFLLQDTHRIAKTLKTKKEGNYKIDVSRSAVWMENTKAFPLNNEFEALLTFVGQPIGKYLSSIAPNAESVSVIQHYSFVQLPDDNYQPREFDPRCGSWAMTYKDYAAPVWESIDKRFIYRHRLVKKNPELPLSEPVKPIVYYVDPGAPEPVRSALVEGASWWNEAFEAIGYKNAFQVKILPSDADPMDLRYNVIQWVHRSTRGWSYGGTVSDPRTGEILKGHVSLGSLRIRQDFLIAQALLDKPFAERDDNYQPMLEMALARIRQLAAHEVGHTLGFSHNFAASSFGRESVMDYPHPMVKISNRKIDLSQAYDTGIGEWDKVTIAYSYSDVPKGMDEKYYLSNLLDTVFSNGMVYVTDSDARAKGGAHPTAHLWDNGNNASEELLRVLKVRQLAIQTFSKDNIRTGEPFSLLEDVFVPLYYFHRYQTEAAVKAIGGLDYSYAVKGGKQILVQPISRKIQEKALYAVLQTVSPKTLFIPTDKLALFPPRAYGYPRTRESFKSSMGVGFDAISVPAGAASKSLQLLLHPQRANRLVQQKALDNNSLSLSDVLDQLLAVVFSNNASSEYEKEIQKVIQDYTLQHLFGLYNSSSSLPQVKAEIAQKIDKLMLKLNKSKNLYNKYLVKKINDFKKHPNQFPEYRFQGIPDGSPIGSFECYTN